MIQQAHVVGHEHAHADDHFIAAERAFVKLSKARNLAWEVGQPVPISPDKPTDLFKKTRRTSL